MSKSNEVRNFKVGDRVKIIDNSGDKNTKIGEIGTVKFITPNEFRHDEVLVNVQLDNGSETGMFSHRFELVEDKVTKFKIGDKVKKVTGAFAPYIGIVEEVSPNGDYISGKIIDKLDGGHWDCLFGDKAENFILLDEKESEAESPEELIKIINEGFQARKKLFDMGVEMEVTADGKRRTNSRYMGQIVEYKLKPIFEEFYIRSWLVKFECGTLHIGRQKFNALELKKGLETLCNQGGAQVNIGNGSIIQATRLGVEHNSGNRISWEEAEIILKALEKVKF